MPQPHTTVRQLAVLCGVSRTTISLALRNHPRIPLATRERIQKEAERLGYRQDPVVSTLMNKLRTSRVKRPDEKIAFLTRWMPYPGWEKIHINEGLYLEGMKERAYQLGYEIEHICSAEHGLTAKRLSQILYTRAVKGVIISPLHEGPGRYELEWRHFATATIGFTVLEPDIHRTAHAHYQGMLLALAELGRLGYRRIGYATSGDQDERVNHGWLGALLGHQKLHPIGERVQPLLAQKFSPAVLKKWIDRQRPDVVLSNWPTVPDMLKDAGLDVPGDIGFASLDLFSDRHVFAGVDQLPKALGAAAADIVAKQMQNNEFGLPQYPMTVQLKGLWRDGPTVRPQRAPVRARRARA